jgi:uncharacterized Tic20 family protein
MTDEEQTVETPDGTPVASNEERTLALVAHLGGFFTSFVAPLVVWLVKKDESEFVADQAKEALNFQITVAIFMVIGGVGTFCLIGIPLMLVVSIADLVLSIVAGLKSYEGHRYRYPFTIRLL